MTRDELRAARRAFITAHHPDRGGAVEDFVAGLARFHCLLETADGRRTRPPVGVVAVRRPRGVWVLVAWLADRRRRRSAPSRVR